MHAVSKSSVCFYNIDAPYLVFHQRAMCMLAAIKECNKANGAKSLHGIFVYEAFPLLKLGYLLCCVRLYGRVINCSFENMRYRKERQSKRCMKRTVHT